MAESPKEFLYRMSEQKWRRLFHEARNKAKAGWSGDPNDALGLTLLAIRAVGLPRTNFESRRQRCPTCKRRSFYSARFDSCYCEDCNRWLEIDCGNPECESCRSRPETPKPGSKRWMQVLLNITAFRDRTSRVQPVTVEELAWTQQQAVAGPPSLTRLRAALQGAGWHPLELALDADREGFTFRLERGEGVRGMDREQTLRRLITILIGEANSKPRCWLKPRSLMATPVFSRLTHGPKSN